MKKLIVALLFLSLTANADAQWFHKGWWKHHILCMCGQQPAHNLGN